MDDDNTIDFTGIVAECAYGILVTYREERASFSARMSAKRYTPLEYDLRISEGPMAGTKAVFTVNADGSVYASDWEALARWRDLQGPLAYDYGLLTLLLAARGRVREVSADERDQIAATVGAVQQ